LYIKLLDFVWKHTEFRLKHNALLIKLLFSLGCLVFINLLVSKELPSIFENSVTVILTLNRTRVIQLYVLGIGLLSFEDLSTVLLRNEIWVTNLFVSCHLYPIFENFAAVLACKLARMIVRLVLLKLELSCESLAAPALLWDVVELVMIGIHVVL
jgi:hypothetical protein